MRQIAMIKDGVIENVAMWEEISTQWKNLVESDGYELVDITDIPRNAKGKFPGIGWLKIDDTHFANPDDSNDKIIIPDDGGE